MNRAYYWYRPHPFFDEFYPGKVLDVISASDILRKYPHAFEIKQFFSDGFSPHGLSMLYKVKPDDNRFGETITELIFELVRQLHFSDAPSRLSCLYASETLEQVERWKNVFQKHLGEKENQTVVSLWEIEFETQAQLHDAHFLNIPSDDDEGFSLIQHMDCAYKYWRGVHSYNPLLELLVPYPVIVSRQVRSIHPI